MTSRVEVELALRAVEEAELQDDPVARCAAYLTAVFAHLDAGEDIDTGLLERAKALAPQVEHQRIFMWPAYCEALCDLSLDRLEASAGALARLRDRAIDAGDWDSLPLVAGELAWAEFRLGRWSDAMAHAREAEHGARVNGQPLALSWALAHPGPAGARDGAARRGPAPRRRGAGARGRDRGGDVRARDRG